ncbi:MAG: hypothetical protein E6I65_05230 [Chloroflexi bacterium]|nr:MAG: hypothetical protein E6I65_05230 [Chloroflexota bacterium]
MPDPVPHSHFLAARRVARVLLASVIAGGAVSAVTGTAFAVEPERDGLTAIIVPPGDNVDQVPGNTSAQGKPDGGGGGGGGGPKTSRGYDISYPQCGGAFPANPAFGIVGVNGGRVFSANPCLSAQIAWGGSGSAELYANTGNPGPVLSSHWPSGQTSPRVCDAANPDTADCAYDYGWNAAQHSFQTAQAAYQSLGLTAKPAATRWWLDVETSNSWRDDPSLNIEALAGEVDYLSTTAGVTRLGFYSTQLQWNTITAGSLSFSAYPSWIAGGGTLRGAHQLCTRPAFTGGTTVLAQYFSSGFDADLPC